MKEIMLAKKSSRIFAGLIDFLILICSTLIIWLGFIVQFGFDGDAYRANEKQMLEYYSNSGLFIVDKSGHFAGKSVFTDQIKKIEDTYNVDITFEGVTYKNQHITKDLYTFYSEKYEDFGKTNLPYDTFCSDILKVGSKDSNIKSFDLNTFKFELIDEKESHTSLVHVMRAYEDACNFVNDFPAVSKLKEKNADVMINICLYIFPVVIGLGLIFNLIIPLCSKENRTIGKYIFKLSVVSKDGYRLNKVKLIYRFLVYIFVEVILGIATFGGLFLVSYTMFLFTKNRRSLHDMVAGTVVIDTENSIYFDNSKEEQYFKDRGVI